MLSIYSKKYNCAICIFAVLRESWFFHLKWKMNKMKGEENNDWKNSFLGNKLFREAINKCVQLQISNLDYVSNLKFSKNFQTVQLFITKFPIKQKRHLRFPHLISESIKLFPRILSHLSTLNEVYDFRNHSYHIPMYIPLQ